MGFFDKPEIISPGTDAARAAGLDGARVAELEGRVARLEAQVAQLLAGAGGAAAAGAPAGVAPEQPWLTEVHRLLARDEKIKAIKVWREHTGAGLAEAKKAVEAIERRR